AHELRDPEAASSGVVAWRLLRALGLTEEGMTRELATALHLSIVEDTGWFRYGNTNPEAYRLAAACVAAGAAPWSLARWLEEENSEASLRLLALVLQGLERHLARRLAILTRPGDMVREARAKPDDRGKLVNYARAVAGAEVGGRLSVGETDS